VWRQTCCSVCCSVCCSECCSVKRVAVSTLVETRRNNRSSTTGATHCTTLQHTAPRCNTLQNTTIHCNTLQHTSGDKWWVVLQCVAVCCIVFHQWRQGGTTDQALWVATHCNTLQHTTPRCNTLHHTAVHCNSLRYTATHYGVATISRLLKIIGLFCRI